MGDKPFAIFPYNSHNLLKHLFCGRRNNELTISLLGSYKKYKEYFQLMSHILTDLSHALTETVQTAATAVVRVDARRRMPASGLVWSADGVVVTANHVVQQNEGIQIVLADGNSLPATLVGRDANNDLAVLRVDATLEPLAKTGPTEVGVGNFVLALARPRHTIQASMGIISGLSEGNRPMRGFGPRHKGPHHKGPHHKGMPRLGLGRFMHEAAGPGRFSEGHIKTDIVMYPGFSGGPLVRADGQLIGLNSSAFFRGISMTIPVATVAGVVETLLTHGRIRRGYFGITTQRVHLPDALQEAVAQKRGLLITEVEAESPAAKAGLTLGDTLITIEGEAVQSHETLLAWLQADKIGTAVVVQFIRGGEVQKTAVEIRERPLG